MNDLQRRHYAEFMQATKGYGAWAVAICVNKQTAGIDWRKSSRGNMASEYAEAKAPERSFSVYPQMARLNLLLLARDLAARCPT